MLIKPLALSALLIGVVVAKTQRLGDECNWSKNCQEWVDGAGPAWANGEVTCAVPQNQNPESCSNNKDERNNFWGTCKAVGTLSATEYGCPCGVHKGNCPGVAMVRRIFWPQDWIKDAWSQIH